MAHSEMPQMAQSELDTKILVAWLGAKVRRRAAEATA
jgi:hypothetical protein